MESAAAAAAAAVAAVVTPVFGRYINEFLSLVEENINAFQNCPDEFKHMREYAGSIQKIIEDIKKKNHGMKTLDHFTNEMRELMYEVEDITADYSHLAKSMGGNSRVEMGKKLKAANEKIRTMQSRMDNFLSIASQNKKDIVERRPCDPINDKTKIVGVGKAVTKIKKWVMNTDQKTRKSHYNCIGLVGKGGSGKTTLAQMILKDEEINKHFHLLQQKKNDDKKSKHSIKKMLFVTVSQPVDVKMMMKSMLKELKIETNNDDDERKMSSEIYDYLSESRYFVILDDVWSLDDGWWETIKEALPKGSENCVLVTSREDRIVKGMGVVQEQIHVPEALGKEDGWSLFCKNVSTDDVSEDMLLKEIGMEIVGKCGGLPLAIKVMAGVVSSYHICPPTWMEIRDSFMQYISDNGNDIVMGSLKLSYDNLPETHLQQCLLCFALFPEDRAIEKDKMIRWWIGEGFVPLKDGRVSVELAEKCFEELVNRSLIDVFQRDYNWKVFSCKVHDLVREMLIQKGKSEAFFEIGKEKISRRIVVPVNDDISTTNDKISSSQKRLRAIVSTSTRQIAVTEEFVKKIYNDCGNLRVLDLSVMFTMFENVMLSGIHTLKHLTYLNVQDTNTTSVPDKISELKSLLVLCLGSDCIKRLPDSITQLNQLIWLDVSFCFTLEYLPRELGNVSTLQVLKGFKPSSPSTSGGCRFEELSKLTQLVTLEMLIKSDDQLSDGKLHYLSKLDRLQRLTIKSKVRDPAQKLNLAKKLDNLILPNRLDEVNLVGYPGDNTPRWLNTKDLPRLRCLSLDGGFISRFNEKFNEGKRWGIAHLELENLDKLSGDWNDLLKRLPHLMTLHSCPGKICLKNYPRGDEFDDESFWFKRRQGA